jgi:hypothetical protein
MAERQMVDVIMYDGRVFELSLDLSLPEQAIKDEVVKAIEPEGYVWDDILESSDDAGDQVECRRSYSIARRLFPER